MSPPDAPEPHETDTAKQHQTHWEAADILPWGGLAEVAELGQLPSHWTDVTDIVLSALDDIRSEEHRASIERRNSGND